MKLHVMQLVRAPDECDTFSGCATIAYNHTAAFFDQQQALKSIAETNSDKDGFYKLIVIANLFHSGQFRETKAHITMMHYVFLH